MNCKIESKISGETIAYKHEDAENSCSFLKIDVEEHPDLAEDDLEPLGTILLSDVEKYIKDNKKLQIVEHSSSFHIMHGGKTYAKVWYNGMASSQIATKDGALKVAKYIVERLEDGCKINGMPKLRHMCSPNYSAQVYDSAGEIAKFASTNDADEFIEYSLKKYGQKIESLCGRSILFKKGSSSVETIIIYDVCKGTKDTHKDILFDAREYIHKHIEEAN